MSDSFDISGISSEKWQKSDLLTAAVLGIAAAVFYYHLAQEYRHILGYFTHNNILFGLDQLDAVKGWVENHKGIHPLLLFIVVPLSKLLAIIAGSYNGGLLLYCGFTGGMTAAVFFLLLRLIVKRHTAVILTVLFVVSMNQMIFAALADTYELVALSLIPGFILMIVCIRSQKLYFHLWLILGLIAFSITITSSIQIGICFSIVLYYIREPRYLQKLILLPVIILLSGFVLSLCQSLIFPGAQHFFQPMVYQHEMQYVRYTIISHPFLVLKEFFNSAFLFSFVGQDPRVSLFIPGVKVFLVYFKTPCQFSWAGIICLSVLVFHFIRGMYYNLKNLAGNYIFIAAAAGLLSNLLLFSFYNISELYLYTPHFFFIILLFFVHPEANQQRWHLVSWWILLIILLVNNLAVSNQMVHTYSQGPVQTLIEAGDVWKYQDGTANPGISWTEPGFDDSNWDEGSSGFGYGDGDDATVFPYMQGNYTSVFLRKHVYLSGIGEFRNIFIDVKYDDGFILFINGEIVLRQNAPVQFDYRSLATADHPAKREERFSLPIEKFRNGDNLIAIQVLNRDINSSDLSMIPILSAELFPMP